MENKRWRLGIACLAFLFITSSSAEFLIQQVTDGNVYSVPETEYNSSYNLSTNQGVVITRVMRDERPSSKIVTITSFSEISLRHEPYESSVFEASSYKWRLVLYVLGNRKDGINDHISLYVRIEETESLPKGWEVNVDLKLFVHNPRQQKYLTVTDGTVKRYNEAKKEWGYGQLILLSTFHNWNEGYIVENTGSFGAEIFIVKPAQLQEEVIFISNPQDNIFRWRIRRFSSLEDKFYYSHDFLVGDRYWILGFNPKGAGDGGPHALPIFLYAQGFKPGALATSTYAAFYLLLRHQLGSNHKQRYSVAWYPIQPGHRAGVNNIILHTDLRDGYLVNDSIVFEVEVIMISGTYIVPI